MTENVGKFDIFVTVKGGGDSKTTVLFSFEGADRGTYVLEDWPPEFKGRSSLAVVAILIKQEILLLFVGGVFVLETMSVILQVGSYKLRHGKRVFKMAPLHHHFEQVGWTESKIIVRFWITGLLLALLALTTLKLR